MSDIERLVNLYWALSGTLTAGVAGDVVELGCNAGHTSVFLRMILNHYDPERQLHVYDSMRGLPEPDRVDIAAGSADPYLRQGDCPATLEELLATFERWQLDPPIAHLGWFHDTLPDGLPDEVCFAYIDGDLYDSVMTSLEHVYPRLTTGAIAVIDDYCDRDRNDRAWDLLPGPKKACDEFFADKPESPSVLVGSNDLAFGYIRKGWADQPRHPGQGHSDDTRPRPGSTSHPDSEEGRH